MQSIGNDLRYLPLRVKILEESVRQPHRQSAILCRTMLAVNRMRLRHPSDNLIGR
jgi:hypothetical protein